MNVKIADIMVQSVITIGPHLTFEEVKATMQRKKVHSLPVVDEEGGILGIVTTNDLVKDTSPDTKVRNFMTKRVYTVPAYNDVHIAARIMRNHHIHHVVVQHNKKIVGIISSFDLLKLVEDHRFVMKNPPSSNKKKKQPV